LGAIGTRKGYDVWIPTVDRSKLDWSLTSKFKCEDILPLSLNAIRRVVEEIDVIWITRGSGNAKAFFEVEHSTPIYSGLLRFNDVYLVEPNLNVTFSVVSNEERRSVFVQQLSRPTFQMSGLHAVCNFLEYSNVFGWHERLWRKENEKSTR
jgi:type II restriction enzyme